jgi:sugar phosphate isomerase/epimerase
MRRQRDADQVAEQRVVARASRAAAHRGTSSDMKVGCNSHSYRRMLAAGELTLLEWVDLCANELNLDGIEFSTAHFLRIDPDYIAQLKKLCVDRCLTVAGLRHDAPLDASAIDDHVRALEGSLALAVGLGAPLVRCSTAAVSGPPAVAWRELVRGLRAACARAKQHNVTIAVEPAPQTAVATAADAKRLIKECDSAWLRLAMDAGMLAPPADQWSEAFASVVIAAVPLASLDTFGADESIDYLGVLAALWQLRYRGFLTLEYGGREAERPAMARAVSWLRGILAKDTLEAAALP